MLVTLRVKRRDLKLHIIISSFESAFVLYHVEKGREGKSRVMLLLFMIENIFIFPPWIIK